MEPSAATEGTPGLNPVGGSFHSTPKKEPRKVKRSTFSQAARVTAELSPASRTSSGPEFHSQHGSFVWQHESVSKKGYTAGFASQTPRLGTSFRYTGPGPGTAVFTWYATATLSVTKATNYDCCFQAHIVLQAGVTSFTAHRRHALFQAHPQLRYSMQTCRRQCDSKGSKSVDSCLQADMSPLVQM